MRTMPVCGANAQELSDEIQANIGPSKTQTLDVEQSLK